MKTDEFTPEKSLQLIAEVIENSRRDFEKNSGMPLVLWGGIVAVVAVVVWWLLGATSNAYWHMLWFVIPVLGYPLNMLLCRKDEKRAKNYVSGFVGMVWTMFGILSILTAVTACFFVPVWRPLIALLIIMMLGFSTGITGLVLKNALIAVCGVVTAIAGMVLISVVGPVFQPLVMGVAAVFGLILPGLVMNARRG